LNFTHFTIFRQDPRWLDLRASALRRCWEFRPSELVAVAWALTDTGALEAVQVAVERLEEHSTRELSRLGPVGILGG